MKDATIKKRPSLKDPIWDVSYDGKTIVENQTFDHIVARYPYGAKFIFGTFTTFDLASGDHKELIIQKKLKSWKLRVQMHPMNAADLGRQVDGFGSIKK